jgi:hypothetical protein
MPTFLDVEVVGIGVSGRFTGLTFRILGMVAESGIEALDRIAGLVSVWVVAALGPFSSLLLVNKGVREPANVCLLLGYEVVLTPAGRLTGV